MKFSTISKVTSAMIAAFIFSGMLASQASAAMTWLSSIARTEVPAQIALDAKGNLYVTEPRGRNRLLVFNAQGALLRTLNGLREPKGVAVDANSRIYVGNAETGSVDVYNPDLTLAYSLGSGKGEFKHPGSIAVTAAGSSVYVLDGGANAIKVYDATGALAFSFGAWGRGNGKFNDPLSIAIDEARSELYVTDRGIFDDPMYRAMGGARVQVFDLNGTFLRSFGDFGSGPGQMKKPEGIAADGAGNLYVTDALLAVIHVFTTSGSWVETISDSAHGLKTPIGIAVGKDKRLFVASSNTPSIEVYGLPGYTTMTADPRTLNFSAVEGGSNPGTQTVSIMNSGNGVLDWTAKATTADGSAWLAATASGSAGASGTSTMTVSVLSSSRNLPAGVYTGTLTVTSAGGSEEIISVNLAVAAPPAILTVDRAAVSFKGQQKGADPLPQLLNIKNAGTGTMAWSAQSSAAWLKLGPSTATNTLTISPSTAGLEPGVYAGSITITAAGAQGSPLTVAASLQVVAEGTLKVTSNIAKASFDITGPVSYSGTGSSWKNDVVPGDYTVTFKSLAGYIKPAGRKVTVTTGHETLVNEDYRKKPVATNVIAGSAHGEALVSIFAPAGGSAPRTFSPLFNGSDASVRIAAGDLDGSGTNAIVVTDQKRSLKVFTDLGNLLSSYTFDGYNHADITLGDIDADGKTDILLSGSNDTSRMIKVLSYGAKALQEKAALFSEDKSGRFSTAVGDVNDDGVMEVVIADANSIRTFSVQISGSGLSLVQLWSKNVNYSDAVQVSTGDLNGDGIAEIVVSYGIGKDKDSSPRITVLKGTGEDYGLTIEPFKDLGFEKACTLAIGDIDGDDADEIIAGAGPAQHNDPVVRIFESDGTYAGITMKPMNGKAGVNVGLGSF